MVGCIFFCIFRYRPRQDTGDEVVRARLEKVRSRKTSDAGEKQGGVYPDISRSNSLSSDLDVGGTGSSDRITTGRMEPLPPWYWDQLPPSGTWTCKRMEGNDSRYENYMLQFSNEGGVVGICAEDCTVLGSFDRSRQSVEWSETHSWGTRNVRGRFAQVKGKSGKIKGSFEASDGGKGTFECVAQQLESKSKALRDAARSHQSPSSLRGRWSPMASPLMSGRTVRRSRYDCGSAERVARRSRSVPADPFDSSYQMMPSQVPTPQTNSRRSLSVPLEALEASSHQMVPSSAPPARQSKSVRHSTSGKRNSSTKTSTGDWRDRLPSRVSARRGGA